MKLSSRQTFVHKLWHILRSNSNFVGSSWSFLQNLHIYVFGLIIPFSKRWGPLCSINILFVRFYDIPTLTPCLVINWVREQFLLFWFVGFSHKQHLKLAQVGGSVSHRGFFRTSLSNFGHWMSPFHSMKYREEMEWTCSLEGPFFKKMQNQNQNWNWEKKPAH